MVSEWSNVPTYRHYKGFDENDLCGYMWKYYKCNETLPTLKSLVSFKKKTVLCYRHFIYQW